MFARMREVHDVHRRGKVFGNQSPDPGRSIAQSHQLLPLMQPMVDG
jgi:hypothetical protein